MRASTAAAFLVGLLIPFTLAAPTIEKVLAPGGYRANTNVREIPAGGSLVRVGSEIHVLDAEGTIVHVATAGVPTKVKSAVSPLETGWVTFASWLNTASSPISSFTTTWTVPPVPATNHDQTIFLFNSIEPNAGDAILQPVLQYLDSANTFFTTPVQTSAGATLNGIITLTGSSGSSYNYISQFTNIPGTALDIIGSAELTWATETLEAYGVTAISDYPAGSTVFSGINLELASGAVPSVSWSNTNDNADGLSTTINTNGAANARITITY
ncbi:hypothetical protein C8F04DRAFT_1176492 [Mycena alexandri]|uniref:Uncharacterized protein n=1 Tax=Mycena alexandri TaxID=1745969 RepID=A0AAD6XA53_9AGAR|nr:hypothetical protein C8F04DRAFT_1176492 [Mycena alexandri]